MTLSQSDLLQIEGSTVESVVRETDSVALRMKSRGKLLRLLFFEVGRELVNHHGAGNERFPVVGENCPVEVIETARVEGFTVILSGYRNQEPWYVWEITARSAELIE